MLTTLYLYRDDYAYSPRETEWSEKVVRFWYDEKVRYADEEMHDDQCLGLVAERLIVRRLLGIDKLDMAYMPKVSRAKPFGADAPMLAELLMPGSFIAMALVPLSPQGAHGRPIIARLYCVSGLANRRVLPLEGMDEVATYGFSWFLSGVSQADLEKGIHGRSWLLAASLLARIVEKRDVKTARNLAKCYIVTGDVSSGAICRVEMLRKPELAKQFDDFKWIIPKENDMDIPKRKIEKPATLEEAYQLIESMRSTATKSFFRFLREGNLAGIKEQYRIGADIFAREEKTDLTCLEIVADMKAQLYAAKKVDDADKVDPESFKKDIRERIAALDEVDRWLRFQGADSSMMFYLLAVNCDETSIARCCEYASINSCDEHGHTAVDLALINEKFEAARLLHRYGGAPNPRMGANKQLADAIKDFCDDDFGGGSSENEDKLIANAVDAGLSPETRVEFRSVMLENVGRVRCTLYAVAVDYANYEVLEACLRNGADANKKLYWWHFEPGSYGESYRVIDQKGTPWAILSMRGDMKGEKRQKFRELLQRYGAKIDEE